MPIDDSWLRDSWPIFVTRPDGTLAVSDYAFNSRGEKCPPYDNDAAVGRRLAEHFGVERFAAPMVLGEAASPSTARARWSPLGAACCILRATPGQPRMR